MKLLRLNSLIAVVVVSLLWAATCALNCSPGVVASALPAQTAQHSGCSDPSTPDAPSNPSAPGCGLHEHSTVAVKAPEKSVALAQPAVGELQLTSPVDLRASNVALAADYPSPLTLVLPLDLNRPLRI